MPRSSPHLVHDETKRFGSIPSPHPVYDETKSFGSTPLPHPLDTTAKKIKMAIYIKSTIWWRYWSKTKIIVQACPRWGDGIDPEFFVSSFI